MAALRYITRGGSSPGGKARVYFTCHEDDFALFFEKISKDVLDHQNCAIWYLDPAEEPDPEQYENDLEQMQLFVIPVTARFLTAPNRARLVDFRFAAEHHKPILPVMVESGLANEFNTICGDLQTVDAVTKDVTAIPYEERMASFLRDVLIGNDQMEKIRKAFDTYIFLSYRKKDRAYAQELMRLIHRNDFCRDIAIWYDEFLVPGESFNDAIRDALQKSPLFALAVTPSLLEYNDEGRPNYVMETEYPMAKKAGKYILPFEMVPTDREALETGFPGIEIGLCSDVENAENIASALKEAVASIAFSTEKKDAVHTFFIGLAYLQGVDVEIDYDRAFAMIREAAGADLPEAMEKLVHMYRYGEGTAREYSEAIRWQERLVRRLQLLYEEDRTDENGCRYVSSMTDLVRQLQDAGRTEEADQICDRICAFCVPLQKEKAWALSGLSWAYNKRGELGRIAGNTQYSEAYLNKNIEVLRELLARYPEDTAAMRSLGVSLNNLGKTFQSQKRTEEAIGCFGEALPIFRQLDSKASSNKTRRDLSATLGLLGNCYYLSRDYENAETCYEQMYQINKMAMEETRSPESIRDYAVSLSKQGLLRMLANDPAGAVSWYLEDVKICEDLAEKTSFFESYLDLSITYDSLRDAYETMGDLPQARAFGQKHVETAEKLDRIRSCVQSKTALRKAYGNLGQILGNLGQMKESQNCMQKAAEAGEAVLGVTGAVTDAHALATVYYNLGMVTGNRSDYQKAYDLWTQLKKIDPRFEQFRQMAKQSMRRW